MGIIFDPEVNETREGENDIDIGKGSLVDAKVALQGFYMSYGEEEDNHIKQIMAWVGGVSTSQRDDNNFIKYKYKCHMYDKHDPRHEASVRIRSLIIAELGEDTNI